jgi:hypothetical protein|nr:hypothetical protein [uncultured Methanoregula sp.]
MKQQEMDPADPPTEQGKKLKDLELELNDLRQGLTLVADYYRDLEEISRKQVASETVDEEILKPLLDDDLEFEGIWRFHEEILEADPGARVPCSQMYEAFVRFCESTGRVAVEKDAFDFVFSQMKDPAPGCDRGDWTGFRLRPVRS